MFGTASRNVIRSVSADFCAATGIAPVPSKSAARIAVPSFICRLMLLSFLCSSKAGAMHGLCQMALYHSLGGADHGRWCHTLAAFDRNWAARIEPAARGNVGRIRHGVAEADIRH